MKPPIMLQLYHVRLNKSISIASLHIPSTFKQMKILMTQIIIWYQKHDPRDPRSQVLPHSLAKTHPLTIDMDNKTL